MKRSIIIIAHNLRSTHNVGSLLRTADGLGVDQVIFSGITPYPSLKNDTRLPHLSLKIDRQINKTALGAQKHQIWSYTDSLNYEIKKLKLQDYLIVAVEQTCNSINLPSFKPPQKLVLIFGREVEGLEKEIIQQCSICLEIPMLGRKESFNVVQAMAIATYHCRYC